MAGRISDVVLGKTYRTSPKRLDLMSAGMVIRNQGRVGKPYADLYRNWAQNSDIGRALVNYFKNQIATAEYDIVPYDRDMPYDKGLRREIRDLFDLPNQATEDFAGFMTPLIEDLIVLDASVIEKERTVGGDLVYLHGVDAGKVYVSALWDGDPDEDRYWWAPTPLQYVGFHNADMVYMMTNPRTYSPVGLSLFETIKLSIDWELNSSSYNARQVTTAAPDGVLDLGEGAKPEQVDFFRSLFQAEVAGRGSLAIIGGTKGANFTPFRRNNREMQFIEWQLFLIRKMCAAAGVSPQDIGFTQEINKAQGEVQQELSQAKGTRPVMARIQGYLTREIVWDKSFGGRENNLAFRYTRLNIKESLDKAQMNKLALAGIPWKTGNEARMDEGRQPIGELDDEENPMNRVLANTPLGIVDLSEVVSAKDAIEGPAQAAALPAPKSPEPGSRTEKALELVAQMSADETESDRNITRALDGMSEAMKTLGERPILIDVHPANVEVHPPEVNVPPVVFEEGSIQVHVPKERRETVKTVHRSINRDDKGRLESLDDVTVLTSE